MQNFIYELSCEKDAFSSLQQIFIVCESETANICQDVHTPVCLRIIYGMPLHIAMSESGGGEEKGKLKNYAPLINMRFRFHGLGSKKLSVTTISSLHYDELN
jgi:hypothetical protein